MSNSSSDICSSLLPESEYTSYSYSSFTSSNSTNTDFEEDDPINQRDCKYDIVDILFGLVFFSIVCYVIIGIILVIFVCVTNILITFSG